MKTDDIKIKALDSGVILSKLESMHRDIKRIEEKTNQEYLDLMLAHVKKDFSGAIADSLLDNVDDDLEKGIIKECTLRETCKPLFKKFLVKNLELVKQDKVSEDNIEIKRAKLKEIREKAPLKICGPCHDELNSIFEKQLKLIQSTQVYKANESQKRPLSSISEELIVKEVLEPLSNKQRIQILKSMASGTKTYSDLSKITGLRGGNLLFHLQKMQDSELILQRHERGDYMITRKGFTMLMILNNIQEMLQKNYKK